MAAKKKKQKQDRDDSSREGDTCTDVFSLVFEKIQTAIVIIDPNDHTIIDANPLAESIIGLPKDQITGRVCHNFICPAQAGKCPITDMHKTVDNSERVLINARGENIPILKTVAMASMDGREYLIESFVDIRDRKAAEERKLALIAFMSEAVARVKIPLELTAENLEALADHAGSGEYDAADLKMQIRIQAKNIGTMVATLQDLASRCARERDDIPEKFRQFIIGK